MRDTTTGKNKTVMLIISLRLSSRWSPGSKSSSIWSLQLDRKDVGVYVKYFFLEELSPLVSWSSFSFLNRISYSVCRYVSGHPPFSLEAESNWKKSLLILKYFDEQHCYYILGFLNNFFKSKCVLRQLGIYCTF